MDLVSQVAPVLVSEATKYISKKATTPAGELATLASQNQTTALRKELEKNPDINRSPALVAAATAGNLSSIDLLLDPPPERGSSRHHHHHDPEKIDLDVWSSGITPLLAAVRNHHLKTAKFLLEEGADPDLCPKSGATALQEASQAGDLDIVRVLLLYGAKINHVDHVGDTPLIVACRWGHANTARCLLQNGARIGECNDKGSTALSVAAKHHNIDVIEELLDEKWEGKGRGGKVNVNGRDKKGRTSLHRAVEGVWLLDGVGAQRKEEVVQILLDAGADARIRDKEGKTAADRVGWMPGGAGLKKLIDTSRKVAIQDPKNRPDYSRSRTF
jgi:ankyrin repeat protein